MDGKTTSSVITLWVTCLILAAEGQKNGFRGGSKSYEIHVEANSIGTNLHYKLPESKVKAASKQDWQVDNDNDNAEMLAMNSPILATVNVKHPKFSMKGQWPGYKTSFKLPKDVSVASKRTGFSKLNHGTHKRAEKKSNQHSDADFPGSGEASPARHETTRQRTGSGVLLTKLAEGLLKGRKPRKKRQENGIDMSKITKLLLPIAGLKNVDLNNSHVSDAMKGVIKHARKVVDEAKTVLNDAANFVTTVRKLVKVTKDHSTMHRKVAKDSSVTKETSGTSQADSNGFAANASKTVSSISLERSQKNSALLNAAENIKHHDFKGRQRILQRNFDAHKHNITAKHSSSHGNKEKVTKGASEKGVEKRSNLDSPGNRTRNKRNSRVHRRGLAETLESILSTINGLKSLSKYH